MHKISRKQAEDVTLLSCCIFIFGQPAYQVDRFFTVHSK